MRPMEAMVSKNMIHTSAPPKNHGAQGADISKYVKSATPTIAHGPALNSETPTTIGHRLAELLPNFFSA